MVVAFAAGVFALSIAVTSSTRNVALPGPLDEGAHYDYVVDLQHGQVPKWGTLLNAHTRKLLSCLHAGPVTSASKAQCANPPPAKTFPAGGYSYEAQQAPLAYLPYLAVTRPASSPRTALDDARWGGVIWAGIACLLIAVYGLLEALPPLAVLGMLALCVLNPTSLYAESTVTNDSAAISAGMIALLVAALARRFSPRIGIPVGLLAGLLVGGLKGLFVLAPLALVVAAVLDDQPWRAGIAGVRSFVLERSCVLALFLGAGVSLLGWTEIQSMRATVSPRVVLHAVMGASLTPHIQVSAILQGMSWLLGMFQTSVGTSSTGPLSYAWSLSVFGVVFALALAGPIRGRLRGPKHLAIGALVALGAIAIGWPVFTYLSGHFNYPSPPRYGLPLIPIIAVVCMRFYRRLGWSVVGLILPGLLAVTWLQGSFLPFP